MSEFSDYMLQKLERGEQIKTPMDIADELNRASGKRMLEEDIRQDYPALRDTLPQLPPPESVDWGNVESKARTNPNVAGQLVGGLADSGIDMLKHPVATASMLTAFPLGLLPGVALETAGEVADSGYDQAYKLGEHLVRNPEDTGHMLKGLGMSIAELPSRAAEMGANLWQDLEDWGANRPKQDQNEMIQKTFEPMRP